MCRCVHVLCMRDGECAFIARSEGPRGWKLSLGCWGEAGPGSGAVREWHASHIHNALFACLPSQIAPTCLQVTRDGLTGELKRTPSWHSFGADTLGSSDSEEAAEGTSAVSYGWWLWR